MAYDDAREIDKGGKETPKRRFDARDFDTVAEMVDDTYNTRKTKRSDLTKQWKDVDRQIAMEPDLTPKMAGNKLDPNKAWMAEMELPLQAQALEVLTADARRLMFPDTGPWFAAHAELTDEYLKKVDFQSMIKGDENEVPSRINQDNADKLVEGFLIDTFRQYDLQTRLDRINAEAFKYGIGVGRGRMETKNVYIHEARGTRSDKRRIPVLVPCSIKNLYLDDPLPSMHSAQVLGPAHIAHDNMRLENLQIAANKGSSDPDDEDGGWMPKAVGKLEADGDGYVQILEMEGDIVVPRKTTRSMVLPSCIVTVAIGKGGKEVIRFRWRKQPFSSYVLFPYHYEGTDGAYPTSPLMKGRPVQIMATGALNRLMDSAALKNCPPISWDKNDVHFASTGGPLVHPGAQWQGTDPQSIKAHVEVGGEPGALSAIFQQAVGLYAELTGVLPGRLGAQTKSHTTAFAKDSELQRGAVRTVDYVRQSGEGGLTRWLDMAYAMGRDALKPSEDVSFFIEAYGGFVEIDKSKLPERAVFEWFGAGGPAEQAQKQQMRLQSAQLAVKLDQINLATGRPSKVDLNSMIMQILREGGWTDLDAITTLEAGTAPAPGLTPAVAATQALTSRNGQVAIA
jgi:hypothetical protein